MIAARCKLIAFDFDGTLADTFPWFESVLDEVADEYGFHKPSREEKAELRHQDTLGILKTLQIPLWKAPRILAHVRAKMQDVGPDIQMFAGIPQSLQALARAGVQLAVVSSNSEVNVRRVLGDDIAALFTHYECGADLFGKPAKLKRVLKRGDVDAGEAMLIGDEIRDIDAARATAMQSGVVAWGYNHRDALQAHGPDMVFDTPAGIAQALVS